MKFDLVVKNGTIVTAADTFQADIGVQGEKITAIAQTIAPDGSRLIEAKGKYVIPGGIDGHTHMEFPFMSTTSADDFHTGTFAAACGGVTTILDFALQGKGESLMQTARSWHAKADPKVVTDYALHMIVRDLNDHILAELGEMVRYGVPSFKVFTTYRKEGLLLDDGAIFRVMEEVRKHNGIVGLHCENNDLIEALMAGFLKEKKTSPEYFRRSKPAEVEGEAVQRAIMLARCAGASMYVVHMSTQYGRNRVWEAQQEGLPVYAETCPHYLFFTDEVYQRKDAANFVMSPPIKGAADRAALWAGLANGDISTVASDHCCFTTDQKKMGKDDFTKIPNGVSGTEVILPILFSEGVRKNRISLNLWVRITSYNPARMFGLYPRKGTLAVGSDADIVVFDPDKRVPMTAKNLHSKMDHSIYEDYTATGWPVVTIVRGQVVQENGELKVDKGWGKYIARKPVTESETRSLLVGAAT